MIRQICYSPPGTLSLNKNWYNAAEIFRNFGDLHFEQNFENLLANLFEKVLQKGR